MAKLKLEPLDKLEIIGKKGREEPFSVRGQRGLYFYIRVEDFDKLIKINELCKSLPEIKVKPLESVKTIGRGSFLGYRPFLLKGYEGSWLCILAEHFRHLRELNNEYRRGLEVEERKREEERKELEARKRKLEEARKKKLEVKSKKVEEALANLRSVIGEAKEAEALKYVPEVMREVEKSFAEINKVFSAAKYDKAIKLIPRAVELANYAKSESIRKARVKVPESKYFYGIISAPKREISFGNIGIDNGNKVYTISHKDLAAVVSDTPLKDYPVTEEYSKTHEEVVSKVLKNHSVVPAAFGQVFKNTKILRVLVKKAYKALKECMKLTDNRVELGVKAVVPKQVVESLDEKKKKALVESGEEIFKALNKKAVESVRGKLFSDRLVLNASFLVDKNKIEKFSGEVSELSEKYKDLKLRYSGPWAPYSFVCIKVGTKGIELGRKEVK